MSPSSLFSSSCLFFTSVSYPSCFYIFCSVILLFPFIPSSLPDLPFHRTRYIHVRIICVVFMMYLIIPNGHYFPLLPYFAVCYVVLEAYVGKFLCAFSFHLYLEVVVSFISVRISAVNAIVGFSRHCFLHVVLSKNKFC